MSLNGQLRELKQLGGSLEGQPDMRAHDNKPSAGEMVSLTSIPPGLLDGLAAEDQNAIVAIVGKPVLLVGYDEYGRAELHFDDPFDGRADYSHTHSIWVAPEFIERHRT